MAWEWSHTCEAYENARNNLNLLPRPTLEAIYAEWHAHGREDHNSFARSCYEKALDKARHLDTGVLADWIWDQAALQALCDNGGHLCWLCPYGCVPHCVTFDDEQRALEEAAADAALAEFDPGSPSPAEAVEEDDLDEADWWKAT